VTFDPAHPLVVTNAKSNHAHVTFDLDAFNTVDLTAKTVTVQPYVVMQPVAPTSIPMRARGVFVVTQDGNFIMNTRPFYDYIDQPSGALIVNISLEVLRTPNHATIVFFALIIATLLSKLRPWRAACSARRTRLTFKMAPRSAWAKS